MKKHTLKELLLKRQQGTITAAELALLETWYNYHADQAKPFDNRERYLKDMQEMEAALKVRQETAPIKLWPRVVAAAVVILVISGIYFFFVPRYNRHVILNPSQNTNAQNGIKPGGNKAVMTLENGKTLTLSSAKTGVIIAAKKLTYNDGTKIESPVTSQLTITTPRGGQYQIKLPDGSVVTLNAASSLKFPASFAGLKERAVQLTGEAYFTVHHDAKQPFRVISKGQIVEDIGTEFNISAYTDETTVKTTLVKGAAKVNTFSNAEKGQSGDRKFSTPILLTPGKQSTLTGTNITVKQVDPSDFVLWQAGKFSFNSEEMSAIMRQVSRWYNVEIVFEDDVQQVKINGTVSRFANILTLLNKLEQTGLVHFKIEGRKIIVTK